MSYSSGSSGRISGASDVALNNPTDGSILAYNASLQKWENRTSTSASSAVTLPNSASSFRPTYPAPTTNGYSVVFEDTFALPTSSSTGTIDTSKWGYELGTGAAYNNSGWGNSELEIYTNLPDNVQITSNGLEIRAINRSYTGYDGTGSWTSGKILTKSKFAFIYGKAEAVIKIPSAKGSWPAFWMLGDSYPGVSWPACSEIDIMEGGYQGNFNRVLGTLHGPGYSGGLSVSRNTTNTTPLSDSFHTYGVEWSPNTVSWLLDGVTYATLTRNDIPQPHNWVFDQPCYMILNLAIANGGFPGALDSSTFQTGTFNGSSYNYTTMYVQRVTVSQRL